MMTGSGALAGLGVLVGLLSGSAGPGASGGPGDAAGPLTAPGISRELAEHRSATLSNVTYDVRFRIPAARDSAITGVVTLGFDRADDGPVIVDFADPEQVRAVRVGGSGVHVGRENGHLIIPAGPLVRGRNEVRIDFVAGDGPLNRRDDFLYTLFVPDRAHEAVPSFDQPDLKARFTLALTVPREWRAVANGAERSREERGADVVYTFAQTEPLPTYLFAFAAGRFQVAEAERDGRRIRLFHRETDSTKVARNLDALFDLHATALRWLEDYTGIPYPFGKFDFVAIPSFQYSGMEHPGAILYRASSLFLDESATQNQELGRASVIAHETAHMWFGDLVTMRWFNDVWMKEVFASFMAAKIVNPSFPELDHELRFLLANYPTAYSVDRTPGANPIRQPLENLSDAGALYGAIIYQKAPIVMRQLEGLTGAGPFRTALRRYLDAHRFGNATWTDLVAELDRVSDLDVPAWSRVWIDEPGRPWITDRRLPTDGRAGDAAGVTLVPSDPAGLGRVWPQRTTIRVRSGDDWRDSTVVVEGAPVTVRIPDAAAAGVPRPPILPNGNGLGYGLFLLDDATVARLLGGLPTLPTPLARAAAWVDLWEMMLEERVDPEAMLALAAREVETEPDELVAQQVLGDLRALYWRYVRPEIRLRESRGLETLLWQRVQDVDGSSRKAAYYNAWRSIATSPEAVERMAALWRGDLEVAGLPLSESDRTTLALQLAVREAPGWEAILDAQHDAIDNPDRRARFAFIRPAVAADPAVRDSFFQSLARVENRSREAWVVTALSYLHHPLRARASLRYIRPGLDLLEEVKETGDIFFPTRWLASTLGGHASPEAAAIVQRFIDEHPDYPPRLMGKLLQEADPLFRAVALRRLEPAAP